MTTDTTAQIAFLAQHTRECPCNRDDANDGCQGCDDTRDREFFADYECSTLCEFCRGKAKVVSFESLRRVCPNCEGKNPAKKYKHDGTVTRGPCNGCQGKGWLPVPLESVDVGKVTIEATHLPHVKSLDMKWDSRGWWLEINSFAYTREYENQAEAVVLGVYESLQPHLAPVEDDVSQPSD